MACRDYPHELASQDLIPCVNGVTVAEDSARS
jgi:hypothetical protein